MKNIQDNMASLRVALILLSLATVCLAQQQTQREGRWIWGSRSPPTRQTEFQSTQRKSASVGLNQDFYRSISARSYPNRKYPTNIYDVLNAKDFGQTPNYQGPPVRQQQSRTSTRHASRTPPPSIVTPGDYPYPFDAKPVDLGDGTSIGWVPEDTLPLIPSKSNGHSSGHFKPSDHEEDFISGHEEEIEDDRYTTLDRLNEDRTVAHLPNPNTYSAQILGGLHPDEVFYADKDLMIIKGGGFRYPYNIRKTNLGDDIAFNGDSRIKPIGNELGEESQNREVPTAVRPAELFAKVPLPFRFVNGNIPTIVKPIEGNPRFPSSTRQQQSFTPIKLNPVGYHPSASEQQLSETLPKSDYAGWGFQTLDNAEDMVAQESNFGSGSIVLPPPSHVAVKRSANPKVVHYHYHSIGNNAKPIVNYQVDDKGVLTKGNRLVSGSVVRPQKVNKIGNSIPVEAKQNPELSKVQGQDISEHSELEDLSQGHHNSLIPKQQIPKRKPTGNSNPSTRLSHVTPTPVSLLGDTDVNFLPPLPRVNPLAETELPVLKSVGVQRHNPETLTQGPQFSTQAQSQPSRRRVTVKGGRPRNPERFMEPRRRRPDNIKQQSIRPRL